MTDYVDSRPTARKRHRCTVCWRWIMPGEDYWRQAGLDRGAAWTNKTCETFGFDPEDLPTDGIFPSR